MFDRFRRFTSRNESGSSSSQPTTGSTQPTSISSGQSQFKKKSEEEELVAEDLENIDTEDAPDAQKESGSKRKASLTPETEAQPPHKGVVESFEDLEAPVEVQSPKSEKKRRKKSQHKGSPKDPTERKHLHVEDLDVERSYVNDLALPPRAPKPERPKRWKHRGDEPLTDPSRLPKGWTTLEPDLDEL